MQIKNLSKIPDRVIRTDQDLHNTPQWDLRQIEVPRISPIKSYLAPQPVLPLVHKVISSSTKAPRSWQVETVVRGLSVVLKSTQSTVGEDGGLRIDCGWQSQSQPSNRCVSQLTTLQRIGGFGS